LEEVVMLEECWRKSVKFLVFRCWFLANDSNWLIFPTVWFSFYNISAFTSVIFADFLTGVILSFIGISLRLKFTVLIWKNFGVDFWQTILTGWFFQWCDSAFTTSQLLQVWFSQILLIVFFIFYRHLIKTKIFSVDLTKFRCWFLVNDLHHACISHSH
jgi:hypothetical protein